MTLRSSINKTLSYAHFFNFPLKITELHFWLIGPKTTTLSSLKKYLKANPINPKFKKLLFTNSNTHRSKRFRVSQKKLRSAVKISRFLNLFSTIKLVAVTGSVAVNNADTNDDIDLMIITSSNMLWLTRLFVVPLIGIFFKRRLPRDIKYQSLNFKPRNAVCLNLWLDTKALQVPASKQNLYTAHEVLGG